MTERARQEYAEAVRARYEQADEAGGVGSWMSTVASPTVTARPRSLKPRHYGPGLLRVLELVGAASDHPGVHHERVRAGGRPLRTRLPFPAGVALDNGSEFLNTPLLHWCRREGVRFTRRRPYRKNDQAWAEQRSWLAVRRLVAMTGTVREPRSRCCRTLQHGGDA